MEDLILAAATGKPITDRMLSDALLGICEDEHSSCNWSCPVFSLNNGQCVGWDKPFKENRGCDCFKRGDLMLSFIRANIGESHERANG